MAAQRNSNNNSSVTLAVIQTDISYMKEKMNAIDDKLGSHYVTKEEFDPVKRLVYGLVGIILVAVVGALLSLVVRQ